MCILICVLTFQTKLSIDGSITKENLELLALPGNKQIVETISRETYAKTVNTSSMYRKSHKN